MRRGIIGKSKYTNPLIHHFELNNSFVDSAGGVSVTSSGLTFVDDAFFGRKVAQYNSGSTGYFRFNKDLSKFSSNNITICYWVYQVSTSRSLLDISGTTRVQLGDLGFTDWMCGNMSYSWVAQTASIKDAWKHLVGIYNKSTQRAYIYVDGVYKAQSGTRDLTLNNSLQDRLDIYQNNPTKVSSLRIYNTILTGTEISYLFDNKL